MPAYLICEDGPLKDRMFTFDEGASWTIGRDEDLCTFTLEDPMVSRKHLAISLENDDYYIENISSTNPLIVNDQTIDEKTKLSEDDLIQIGNHIFRFTHSLAITQEANEPIKNEDTNDDENKLSLGNLAPNEPNRSKWMIKVISGPSSGGQFFLQPSKSYVIGSDLETSDIILHDLSISKNHARITLTEDEQGAIIDLNSRNGIFVNQKKIENDQPLNAQDLITLGTTSLLFVDIENTRDTIYSTGMTGYINPEEPIFSDEENISKESEKTRSWKDIFIPTKHIAVASVFTIFLCTSIITILSLFRSSQVETVIIDRDPEIKKVMSYFEDIRYNFTPSNSTLFLSGHVLTDLDYNELLYKLNNMTFIEHIEDNVIIDQSVYEGINAVLLKNPAWNSILMTARQPGKFLLTGYINNEEEKAKLTDYINKHFNYLNLLENQVVVEELLHEQIKNLLLSHSFLHVSFEQNKGRLLLSGRIEEKKEKDFKSLIRNMSNIHGIRVINNLVITSKASTTAFDLSSKYTVSGSSKFGNNNQYVLINGKILGPKDMLDGMIITNILNNEIQLEKDGVKYKIDFNN